MQFGNFAMADPKEAAPILDLAQRVRQHVLRHRYNSPEKGSVFNFALFGSPGSGKSFLAREIARLIDLKGAIFSPDEFNLSQFTEPAQLTRALEVIASKSVGGKVPLVLWDEFDSVIDRQRGGWLARFLMPMQDAHFFDGRQKWPIGTAVFVFIGGTFPTAEEFRAWACRTTKPDEPPSEAVLLKARDFHSRLYTALDMPSIVEKDECVSSATGHQCQIFRTDWVNSYAKLARAVLLREFFRNNSKIGKTVFLRRVEDDLCKFLLAIPLRHGARSLQRIVEACLVSKPSRVSMLHLPPPHFLAEHIETENVRRDGSENPGMTIGEMLDACRG
jgi:AAA domain (dynein-related subfamily)